MFSLSSTFIIQFEIYYFFINKHIFHHLKLEIVFSSFTKNGAAPILDALPWRSECYL